MNSSTGQAEENMQWLCSWKLGSKKSPALFLPLLKPYNQMPVLQAQIPKNGTGLDQSYAQILEPSEKYLTDYIYTFVCFSKLNTS